MTDRQLPLGGIHNFRDYGGYRAGDGQLRHGVFFRSAQHGAATDADLQLVDRLGLAAVIDLRGDGERKLWPCRRGPGFAARLYFAPGAGAAAPHHAQRPDLVTADDAEQQMLSSYRSFPYRPLLTQGLAIYLSVLAEVDGPSLVHCFAGKDRTGFAVALFHRLLGVHPDDVMADYLLTNTAGDGERRIAEGAAEMLRKYSFLTEEAARALMAVRPQYLEAAFDAVAQSHGSVETYARDVLNVTPDRLDQLRERALV